MRDSRPRHRQLGEIAKLYGMRYHGGCESWKRLGRLDTLVLRISVLHKTHVCARLLSTHLYSCRGPRHSLPLHIDWWDARCRSESPPR